jgi:hypothetical protein
MGRDMNDWKLSDKKWVQERKKSWKLIKKVFQKESDIMERCAIPYFEDYFLYGKEIPPNSETHTTTANYLIYKLWLHPDQSEKHWQKLIAETEYRDFVKSKELFKFYNHATSTAMNGLEERLVKIFFNYNGDSPEFEFKGKDVPTGSLESFFPTWYQSMYNWTTAWANNPYYGYQYLTALALNSYKYMEEKQLHNAGVPSNKFNAIAIAVRLLHRTCWDAGRKYGCETLGR